MSIHQRLELENNLKLTIHNLIQYHKDQYINADEMGLKNTKKEQGKHLAKYLKISKLINS